MKERPVLYIAIIFNLVVELILITLVFNAVGAQRLPYQLARLIALLLVIAFVSGKSKFALFLLAGYHIFNGIANLHAIDKNGLISEVLAVYHLSIALIIYFHDWIENKMKINKKV